ncbi:MAG: MBL fold metallo-hydrolase [Candidatus Heimdallarchaeota archaeon]|nr:MBL fold metallo-hydrolase [Candidatus Heimdallarchaeota archaeon]
MLLQAIASGSNGNCFVMHSSGHTLLIDAGISRKRIIAGIKKLGLDTDSVQYILITHSHADHTSGLAVLHDYMDFRVVAHPETIAEIRDLQSRDPRFAEVADRAIPIEEAMDLAIFNIIPIHAKHDVAAYAYSIFSTEENLRLTYTTDNNELHPDLIVIMKQSDFIFIESNNDPDMLTRCRYPAWLKQRIRGTHMSNASMIKSLESIINTQTKLIMLGHLSEEANTPGHVCEIMGKFQQHVKRKTTLDFRWVVCTRYESSAIISYQTSLEIGRGVTDLTPIKSQPTSKTITRDEYIRTRLRRRK